MKTSHTFRSHKFGQDDIRGKISYLYTAKQKHFSVTIDCIRFPIRRFPLYTYSMHLTHLVVKWLRRYKSLVGYHKQKYISPSYYTSFFSCLSLSLLLKPTTPIFSTISLEFGSIGMALSVKLGSKQYWDILSLYKRIHRKFLSKLFLTTFFGIFKEFRIIRKRKVGYDVTNTSLECRNKLEFCVF